jgi:hypothetical protein
MTIVTKYTLDESQYITDLNIDINHQLTHVEAPTGRGKTTYMIEVQAKKSKIIMVCPTNIQVAQIKHDYRDNPSVQCITDKDGSNALSGDIIICVYDQLKGLLESGRHFSTYTLVVDEAHKIYEAASYRDRALSVILDAIINKTFKQVITVSATFQPDIFPLKFDEQILISYVPEEQPDIEIMYYKNKALMTEQLIQISPSEGMVDIIRLNNIEQIKHAKYCFELQGLKVLEIHSKNQKSAEVSEFLTSSKITGCDIVLTTSLLDEAINIKNTNIEYVHVFHKLHADELKQFIGRNRQSTPKVFLHLLNSELNREEISIDVERKKIESLSRAALAFCNELTNDRNKYDAAVSSINATTKRHRNLEPLQYDFTEDDKPYINKMAILAQLYRVSMEAQYVNDQSLEAALRKLNCFDNIDSYPSEVVESDEEIRNLSEQAEIMIEAVKQKAIEECVTEITNSTNDVTSITKEQVGDLAEKYQQSGVKGDITQKWQMLCLILPVHQALDAIQKNREKEIWLFHEAASKRLDLRAFFVVLMNDLKESGSIKLNGKAEIIEYFLLALRAHAKKQKGFKEYIQKLKITGLEVMKNNKFKLTANFIYHFIRHFTEHSEKYSGGKYSFIITGIGPFGYDYNIRQIRTTKTMNYKRTKRVKAVDPVPE